MHEQQIDSVVAWLLAELRELPEHIRAVYVEQGESVGPAPHCALQVNFDAVGFEQLGGGSFDPENEDHLADLGEFTWEGSRPCSFAASEHPEVDWLAVLRAAALNDEVQSFVRSRGLLLIFAEHDGPVEIART